MMGKILSRLLRLGRMNSISNVAAVGLALLVSSVLMIVFMSWMLREDLIEDGLVQARIVSANSSAVLLFADKEAAMEILSAFVASKSIQAASIHIRNGEMLAQFLEKDVEAMADFYHSSQENNHHFHLRYLDIVQQVVLNGENIGFVTLRFGLWQFYKRLLSYIAMIMMVALGAFFVMSFFLSRMKVLISRAESHLDYLAHTDSVTALPNRHAFNKKLAESLELADKSGGAVGLILLDLDNFKVVNDTLGHQCGDALLRMFSQRLIEGARTTDIVCRIGGDEFVVIVHSTNRSSSALEIIINRITTMLEEPFRFGEQEFFLTASLGSSFYPSDAGDSETLIRNADTAMYSAKLKGKNTFEIFIPEMDRVMQRRRMLENSLRRALEKDEITVHYQPQIDLRSRKIVGVEALMRWDHPEYGSISPAEFIPVAEETGLIVPLGKWIMRTACRQNAAWNDAGIEPIRIAVNLSTRQMREPCLIQDIKDILQETGLLPSQLELEITEGLMMENVHSNIQLLHSLQQIGVSISIDDFGTGYSSMSYLKRFPINQLKIDRSFVHDIHLGGEAIISAILAMAHSLGLSVVAEGVETLEQIDFLESIGCDIVQGYYFSRPAPAEQFLAFLLKNRLKPVLA